MDMVGELSSRCVRIAGVRHIEVVFQMGAPRVIRCSRTARNGALLAANKRPATSMYHDPASRRSLD